MSCSVFLDGLLKQNFTFISIFARCVSNIPSKNFKQGVKKLVSYFRFVKLGSTIEFSVQFILLNKIMYLLFDRIRHCIRYWAADEGLYLFQKLLD